MRKPTPDQRRALRLLAWSGHDGMTEALLAAHGIETETLVGLVKAGLATARVERLGRPRITRTVVRITDAGRRVFQGD
jgi:DNA-binding PadR family transcriptional regulator